MVSAVPYDLFRGKRVVVTGDTGFKGSWLALWLHDLGAEVTGLALPPDGEQAHFNQLGLAKLIHHVDGDIRDLATVTQVFAEAEPEIVFHLAAQALVRRSYSEPKTTFDTNLGGSVNILEAVRGAPSVRALVYITSDKCYRNKEVAQGYREDDELGGRDPYSASKAAAEHAFAAYRASFFASADAPGLASTRAGNVIGGGDWSADRIVPDCIKALAEGRDVVLRNPNATRPWQHVLDPLNGYLLLAANLYRDPCSSPGSWNFGPGADVTMSVGDLAQIIVTHWGSGRVRIETPPDLPHEATLLHLDTGKAHNELGWQPRWALARTIAETIDWYKKVTGGTPALETTRAQIATFMADRS